MRDRPYLRALADRAGILPEYVDIHGVTHVTSDDTYVALLAAMGHEAATETTAALTLAELDLAHGQQALGPVRVVVCRGEAPLDIPLTIPGREAGEVAWEATLRTESGACHTASGRARLEAGHRTVVVSIPAGPPPGYHKLDVVWQAGGREYSAEQTLIVAPPQCLLLSERVGTGRAFGVWGNLYTFRSERNWGVGDLTDLAALAAGAGRHGASFVGVNPLHALWNRGDGIGPYCPVSRLYRNLIYLDVEAVPELADCPAAQRLIRSPDFQAELARTRAAGHVDYERVAGLKTSVLRVLFEAFTGGQEAGGEIRQEAGGGNRQEAGGRRQEFPRGSRRGGGGEGEARRAAFEAYVAREGRALDDFATFCALHAWLNEAGPGLGDWRRWPAAYRSPRTPEVDEFRRTHTEKIEFHRYVQFELDRQLSAGAEAARAHGMALGIYQDLAVGSAGDGSDAWAFSDLFVSGVEVGAPPDPYSDVGQTWGFPPLNPQRLASSRYEYWIRLLRGAMGGRPDCGENGINRMETRSTPEANMAAQMLRIDHVMGLVRQFWVPDGHNATQGAYVRFPAEDLFGILALESRRNRCVIVGEDLGTVPAGLPKMLQNWGVLSSRVLYFEREGEEFRPARTYSSRALVTVTTHDHPPIAGYWAGRDIELKQELGILATPAELASAWAERERSRRALLRRLRDEGFGVNVRPPKRQNVETTGEENLKDGAGPEGSEVDPEDLCAAVHAFLARTPAPLVGVSLDDLAGDIEPVNLPGVGLDRYRSWSRRMGRTLDDLLQDPRVLRVLTSLREGLVAQR